MKREILKREENEDGSYTQVEKITQTPEDGFVSSEELGMYRYEPGKRRWVKGKAAYVTYETNDPKIVYKMVWIIFPAIILLFSAVFSFMIFLAKDEPDVRKKIQLIFAASMLLIVFMFVKMLLVWGKKKKESKEKERMNKQDE